MDPTVTAAIITAVATVTGAIIAVVWSKRRPDDDADGESTHRPVDATQREPPPQQSGSQDGVQAQEEGIEIAFDQAHNFSGGEAGARTIAYQLLRANSTKSSPIRFHLKSKVLDTAKTRLIELKAEANRSPDEEEEFRHLLKVRDGTEDRLRAFEKALDLAINNPSVADNTFMLVEGRLTQFLLGLRDQLFGMGTPLLPGNTDPDWGREALSQRRHTWYVWWKDSEQVDTSIWTTIDVDDAAVNYVEQHGWDAEGLYVLDLDTFHRIVLPGIAAYLVQYVFKTPTAQMPPNIFDFRFWHFSPHRSAMPVM